MENENGFVSFRPTPITACEERVAVLRGEALDAEAQSQFCGYYTSHLIAGMEDRHPVESVLLLMPLGMLAALSNAKAALVLEEAGAIERAEQLEIAAAAMERSARGYGVSW